MKRIVMIGAFVAAAAMLLASCKKDENKVKYYTSDVTIETPAEGFIAPASYKVVFNNVGTGESRTKTFTSAHGQVDSLITGIYNVTVSAQYASSGFAFNYIGTANNVSIGETNTACVVPVTASRSSALVFKEIHYNASKNERGKPYLKDTYFEVYNNSDQTVYADGLCLGDAMSCKVHDFSASAGLTGKPEDYVFIGTYIWQIPGSGTQYPIAPGESFVIAAWAKDHSAEAHTVDLSTAEFETVCQKYLDKGQTDCNAVNMTLVCTIKATGLANQLGQFTGAAWVLFSPSVPLRKDGHYLESNAPNNYGQEVLKSDVLDAVDCVKNETADKRLPADIDAGKIWCKGTGGNQSIVRKVASTEKDGRKVFQDTNNTSEDFEVNPAPAIRRNGAKRPGWSTWTTAQ